MNLSVFINQYNFAYFRNVNGPVLVHENEAFSKVIASVDSKLEEWKRYSKLQNIETKAKI